MRFRASDVAAATGGRLVGPDVDIEGAGFDTRTLRPGQLFVPLVAERDGQRANDRLVGIGDRGLTNVGPFDTTGLCKRELLHGRFLYGGCCF